ncbi:hypothetical protein [Shewanella sp. HN-41]|uniref:hypothetical protein n=1 Tax=Shewanella sp. HN-41 TaxID=327275 RepID=UPI00056C301C|nr:hypothetical protein [Shewanella sp. HN-41]
MANFKTLVKIHVSLGVVSFVLFGISTFSSDTLTESGKFYLPIVTFFFPAFHFSIAYGCQKKKEIARIVSRVTGFLLMPFFPVGTIIGFIIFENTKNKTSEIDA